MVTSEDADDRDSGLDVSEPDASRAQRSSDTATLTRGGTADRADGIRVDDHVHVHTGRSTLKCARTVVYTSVVNMAASDADNQYNSFSDQAAPQVAFAPSSPGTYRWRASYVPGAGDVNNLAYAADCNAANESFVVQQFQPTLSTQQTLTVKDKATISVAGGGNLSGTATFELHTSAACNDANPPTQNIPVSGASPQNPETTAITYTTSAAALYWKVSYASTGNTSHANIPGNVHRDVQSHDRQRHDCSVERQFQKTPSPGVGTIRRPRLPAGASSLLEGRNGVAQPATSKFVVASVRSLPFLPQSTSRALQVALPSVQTWDSSVYTGSV